MQLTIKKILILIVLHFIVSDSKLFAQNIKKLDTVYVICYQSDLSGKFHIIKDNQSKIDFFFNIKWKLHEGPIETIIFNSITENKNGFLAIPLINAESIERYKNLYTLEQFTKALSNKTFFSSIASGKVQIMMLYGEKCSTKFEMYPVKVGTDLSSEG